MSTFKSSSVNQSVSFEELRKRLGRMSLGEDLKCVDEVIMEKMILGGDPNDLSVKEDGRLKRKRDHEWRYKKKMGNENSHTCKISEGVVENKMLHDLDIAQHWLTDTHKYVYKKAKEFLAASNIEAYRQLCRCFWMRQRSMGSIDVGQVLRHLGSLHGFIDIRSADFEKDEKEVSWYGPFRIYHNSGEVFFECKKEKKIRLAQLQDWVNNPVTGEPQIYDEYMYDPDINEMFPGLISWNKFDKSPVRGVNINKMKLLNNPSGLCNVCHHSLGYFYKMIGDTFINHMAFEALVCMCDTCQGPFELRVADTCHYMTRDFLANRSRVVLKSQGINDYMNSISNWISNAATTVSGIPEQLRSLIDGAKEIQAAGKLMETFKEKSLEYSWIYEVIYLTGVSAWQVYTIGWAPASPIIAYTVWKFASHVPTIRDFFANWINQFIELMTAKVRVAQSLTENVGLVTALTGLAALVVNLLQGDPTVDNIVNLIKKISSTGFDIVVKGGKTLATVADVFQYLIEKAFSFIGIAFPTQRGDLMVRMSNHTKFFNSKGCSAQYWVGAYSNPKLMRELDHEICELTFSLDLAMRLKADSSKQMCQSYLGLLKSLKQDLDSGTTAFSIERAVPAVLQFQGSGGVGKSTLMNRVEDLLLMQIGKLTEADVKSPLVRGKYVYGFSFLGNDAKDQYMSGYNDQLVLRWDEVAQQKDSQMVPSSHNILIMKMVDSGIWMTPQAFAAKGKVPFLSPFVHLTTNKIGDWSVDKANWASPWPIHRRLHNTFIVERKDKYINLPYVEYDNLLKTFKDDDECPAVFRPVTFSVIPGATDAHGTRDELISWTKGVPVEFSTVMAAHIDNWVAQQRAYLNRKNVDLTALKDKMFPNPQKYDTILKQIEECQKELTLTKREEAQSFGEFGSLSFDKKKDELVKNVFPEKDTNLKGQVGILEQKKALAHPTNKKPKYKIAELDIIDFEKVDWKNLLRVIENDPKLEAIPEGFEPWIVTYKQPIGETKDFEWKFGIWDGKTVAAFNIKIAEELHDEIYESEEEGVRPWYWIMQKTEDYLPGQSKGVLLLASCLLVMKARLSIDTPSSFEKLAVPFEMVPLTPEQQECERVRRECMRLNSKFQVWWLPYIKSFVQFVGFIAVGFGVFKGINWYRNTPRKLESIKGTLVQAYDGMKEYAVDGYNYIIELKNTFVQKCKKFTNKIITMLSDGTRSLMQTLKDCWHRVYSWFRSKTNSGDKAKPDNEERDKLLKRVAQLDATDLVKSREFLAGAGEHFVNVAQSWNSDNVPKIAPKSAFVRVSIKPNEIPTVLKSQGALKKPTVTTKDFDADALQMRMLKNTVVFYGRNGGLWNKLSNALFVYARTCLIPKHCWNVMKELDELAMFRVNSTSNWVGKPDELVVMDVPHEDGSPFSDLVSLTWKKDLISFKSLLKHFPNENDLAGFTRVGVNVNTVTEIIKDLGPDAEITLFFKSYISDSATAVDNEKYYLEGFEKVKVRKGYSYPIPTVNTDCGGGVSARNPHMQRKIIGIHTAGDGDSGFCVALTRKSVEAAIPKEYSHELTAQGGCPVYTNIEHVDDGEVSDESYSYALKEFEDHLNYRVEVIGTTSKFTGSCTVVGKANYPLSKMTSRIIPSPITNDLPWPARKLPATTERYVIEEGERIDVMQRCFEKCHSSSVYVEPDLFDDCCEDAMNGMYTKGWEEHCRILTIDEVVFGVEDDPYLGSVKINSSPGVVFKKLLKGGKSGKSQWINLEKRWIAPELRLAVAQKLNEWKQGIRRKDAFSGERKSELRLPEKVNHPRLYNAGEMVTLLCTKMLFGALVSWCCRHWQQTGVTVGLNPYEHFGLLEMNLTSRGPKVFAGDFKRFDGSLQQRVLDGVLMQFIKWYERSGRIEPEYIRMMYTAVHVIKFCHMVMEEFYIELYKINPSGNYLTTVLNSFCVKACLRYIWVKVIEEARDERKRHKERMIDTLEITKLPKIFVFPTLVDYNKHVYEAVNGDDNGVNVSDLACDYYNQLTVADGFKKYFAMEYTDDNKTKDFVAYKSIFDITYLKRSFSGQKFGRLDKGSIEEIFHWCKNGQSTQDNFNSSVDSAMCEAMLYGEAYYTYIRMNVLRALSRTNIKFGILTFREAWKQFCLYGGKMFPVACA